MSPHSSKRPRRSTQETIQPHLNANEVMEHLILEIISKHVEYKKVSRRVGLTSLKANYA